MNGLKRIKFILDALYWKATAIAEVANSAGELIELYRERLNDDEKQKRNRKRS
jgi:hypothetical protein